jgi:hypothetical protein
MYQGENAGLTPYGLFWVSAILIKERMVALDDLYPHLAPFQQRKYKR